MQKKIDIILVAKKIITNTLKIHNLLSELIDSGISLDCIIPDMYYIVKNNLKNIDDILKNINKYIQRPNNAIKIRQYICYKNILLENKNKLLIYLNLFDTYLEK